MSKNLRLYYILTFAFVGVVVAWKSFSANLLGAGGNFFAVILLLALMLVLTCTNKEIKSRTFDLFIVSCVFAGLEMIVYMVLEIFNRDVSLATIDGINLYQSIVSLLGLIFFIYIVFRLITEVKGVKVAFVEAMLGHKKGERKIKKAKELTNGSLMEKPNNTHEISNFTNVEQTERVVEPEAKPVYKNEEDSEN